jgi:hypothetical protein
MLRLSFVCVALGTHLFGMTPLFLLREYKSNQITHEAYRGPVPLHPRKSGVPRCCGSVYTYGGYDGGHPHELTGVNKA